MIWEYRPFQDGHWMGSNQSHSMEKSVQKKGLSSNRRTCRMEWTSSSIHLLCLKGSIGKSNQLERVTIEFRWRRSLIRLNMVISHNLITEQKSDYFLNTQCPYPKYDQLHCTSRKGCWICGRCTACDLVDGKFPAAFPVWVGYVTLLS